MNTNLDEPNFTTNISFYDASAKVKKHSEEKKSVSVKKRKSSDVSTRKEDNDQNIKNDLHSSQVIAPQQIISSVFKNNPEIPSLNVIKYETVSEPLFTGKTFEELDMLHPHLVSCLKNRMKHDKLTAVQERTIPVLLNGQDACVKSCTGSGKTLSYAIPIVQKLQSVIPKIKRSDGIFALVIVPTRELAVQCYECFSNLTKAFTWIVPGYLVGGENKRSEKARLRKGVNILVCTPGRFLDHLELTVCLKLDKIKWLVIDEADKLLELGFQASVKKIISALSVRQTVLLSATLTKEVENLAEISLRNPVHVDVASDIADEFVYTLPQTLKQSIVVVPAKLRLTTLSACIMNNCLSTGFKGLIFMSTTTSVEFYHSLLSGVLVPLIATTGNKCKLLKLQGNMKQEERNEIFKAFRSANKGILLCTDVAARGLNFLDVDWVLQYSAPISVEMYVHRVGRTARIGKEGISLLFLLPSETQFSNLLHEHKIQFQEIGVTDLLKSLMLIGGNLMQSKRYSAEECASALQARYEEEVYKEKDLLDSAKIAFDSYVQAYTTYPLKTYFPFKQLHLGHTAKSFCLREAPSNLGRRMNMQHLFDPKRNSNMKNQVKRQKTADISEFDSGLSEFKQTRKKAKRK